jgi:dolichol-phosphate mannosyltransferase
MKVWIVLPAYNEEKALPPLIDSIVDHFSEERREFSIIIVDDGSADGTGDVIEGYARNAPVIALHNDGNRGLAETMRRGLLEAVRRAGANDIIVTMDADNTHPAGLALRMSRLIREGNDVIIASRYREGSHVIGVSLHRRFLSYAASWLFRILFPIRGVRDYTCGYRAYRAGVMKSLVDRYGNEFISERGFSCTVDILFRLRPMHPVISEVPLVLRYDLKPTHSKMKVLATIVDTLKLAIRRRFRGV